MFLFIKMIVILVIYYYYNSRPVAPGTHIHTACTHRTHAHGNAHTARQDKGSETYTEAHTHAGTHTHVHPPYVNTKAAIHSPS